MTKMFKEEIRKLMEVYMDDMLLKSKKVVSRFSYLGKTFKILRY